MIEGNFTPEQKAKGRKLTVAAIDAMSDDTKMALVTLGSMVVLSRPGRAPAEVISEIEQFANRCEEIQKEMVQ